MIRTQIIGHLGQSASINNVNGTTVINFSVAHTESYKNKDGVKVESTTWINCSYFTEKTAVAQYLKKGTQVYLEGQISAKLYKQRNGQEAASLNLRVTSIQLIGGKKEETTSQQPQPETQSDLTPSQQEFLNQSSEEVEDDSLPF